MSWGGISSGPLPPNEDRHWVVNLVGWLGTCIATIFVACRLFTRYHLIRAADWCDLVLAFSAILGIIATSLQTVAGYHGAGRHIQFLTEDQITKASLFGTVGVPFGQIAMALPKIATAAVLLKIAGPSAGLKTRFYLFANTGLLLFLSILYCIFLFVQCTPVFALWTAAPGARCWSPKVIEVTGILVAALSVFVDINLTLYPIMIMRKLQMDLRKKVSVCVLMGLGLSATVCACFKIPHLQDQVSPDVTWDVVALTCWTLAEINLILISASIPLLRPFWQFLRGRPVTAAAAAASTGGLSGRRSPYSSRRPLVVANALRRKPSSVREIKDEDDFVYNESPTPRGRLSPMMSPPPPAHDIKVESVVTITHESV